MEEHELFKMSSEFMLLNGLLNALKNKNIVKFQELLKNASDANLDYFFGDPDLVTLLDFCCMNSGFHAFVNLLLAHGADPNVFNEIRKKAPIHFCVNNGDLETLESLLDCNRTDVNILDATGSTALHYAVKLDDISILERLLQCEAIDLNVVNKKGKSPLLIALEDKNRHETHILALLKHDKLDIDGDPKSEQIKVLLNSCIPNWNNLVKPKQNITKEVSYSHAFNLLQNGRYDEFISIIKERRNDSKFLDNDNGDHTFLQYCCIFGISSVAKELLLLMADPNKATKNTSSPPLMLAARKGYVSIVRMLINTGKCLFTPVKSETVLHHVVKGASEEQGLEDSEEEKDHLACLTMLLTDARITLDNDMINLGDSNGNTALHYAVKQGENEMVLRLLQSGASITCFNALNEPAFADINYKTFKRYLDSCVQTNNKLPREDDYEIILNYSCLRPVYNSSSDAEKTLSDVYNSEDISSSKMHGTFESKSLLYIAENNELKKLLTHPIFTSFLYLKWNKIYKCFYVNLLFYCIFLLTMTTYVLDVYTDIHYGESSSTQNYIIWYFLLFLLFGLTIRELAQFLIAPCNYLFSLENLLEIGIIITSASILFYGDRTSFENKIELSIVSIMFSWSELVLLIGKHPALSTYIEMLKTVSWNFLKFLAWYFALIIAFSLSFYILFGVNDCSSVNKNNGTCQLNMNDSDATLFSSPSESLFKTVVMITGEFEASSVPFKFHPGLSHALFIAFLFFIAIVLFNLLNGLAISDTQAIRSDSELVGYISRVKLIAFIETLVHNPLPNHESIFNWNFSSCWESSLLNYYKNKMTSKFINLFHDGYLANENEIRILPNNRNRVIINNSYQSKRRESDSRCYKRFSFVEMDSTILHAIKELLLEKHVEKELEKDEQKKQENEKMCFEMIRECTECIKMVRQMVGENKAALDKLTKMVNNSGWTS